MTTSPPSVVNLVSKTTSGLDRKSVSAAGFDFQTIRFQHESDLSQKVVGFSVCVCVLGES